MKVTPAIVLAAGVLLAPIAASAASSVVTACASDTQRDAGVNLAEALAAGGSIFFKCPPNTVITIAMGHAVPGTTVIDGEGRITLDAKGAPLSLITSVGHLVVLRRITIRNFTPPVLGLLVTGSVLNGFVDASATLDTVTIEDSQVPIVVGGDLRAEQSTFARNRGYALVARGTTTVAASRFVGNETGALINRGTVRGSTFTRNETAIFVNVPDGPVAIIQNRFERNTLAVEVSQRSGLGSEATVSLRRNRFEDNTAGALSVYDNVQRARDRGQLPEVVEALSRLAPGRFTLAYNSFLRNTGPHGAAIDADLGPAAMTVTGDIFMANTSSGEGGAIAQRGGSLAIGHSLFRANRSASAGGAVHAVPGSGAQLSIANSLIVENVSAGSAIDADAVDLANVTIAANVSGGVKARGAATIANVILSRNRSGNCAVTPAAVFRGGNLQFGNADCPGVAVGDPFLDALYIPEFGSPALTLGDAQICASPPVHGTDILFQSRLDGACALGAFERPPLRHVKPTRKGDNKGKDVGR